MSVNSELASAVKEVIYNCQDMNPTEALKKVASEYGLNAEKIKRVAEASNNMRVLHMYKTSSDKTQNVPLANAEQAIADICRTEDFNSPHSVEKAASSRELDSYYRGSDDFYLDARSASLRAPLFDVMLKQADLHDPSVQHVPEYEKLNPIPAAFTKLAALKAHAENAAVTKQAARDTLEIGALQLSAFLKRNNVDFQEFEKEAYLLHGKTIRPVVDMLAVTLKAPRFTGELTHQLVKDAAVHHKMLNNVFEKFAAYIEAFTVAQDLAREAGIRDIALTKLAMDPPHGPDDFTTTHDVFGGVKTETAAGTSLKDKLLSSETGLNEAKAKEIYQNMQHENHGSPSEFMSLMPKSGPGGSNPPVNYGVMDLLGHQDKIKDFIGAGEAKKSKLNPTKIRAIAQYAIQKDPILSQRNPHAVVQAYKTMITASPTAAHDPNAVISFLRQATMGDTVNYNTIKDLTEIEKNFGQVKNWESDSRK